MAIALILCSAAIWCLILMFRTLLFSQYLEVIFGSAHFKELVKEIDMEISEKFIESHSLQEKLLEVQSKIEVLQPEVKKWQR